MAQYIKQLDYTKIKLESCSIADYCEFSKKSKYNGFWWYLLPDDYFGNYSRPFQNKYGEWFFWIKPFFCWPADLMNPQKSKPSSLKNILGYQIRTNQDNANSYYSFRMIDNLSYYNIEQLSSSRRNLIRKGNELSIIKRLIKPDSEIIKMCLNIWNEHSNRTGWKKKLSCNYFYSSWSELLDCPGTTILYLIDNSNDRIIGWIIIKVLSEMAYIDTIATATDKGKTHPNDSLIYTAIMNLKDIPQAKSVQYGLSSSIESLENFKESLGFTIHKSPAILHVNPVLKFFIKSFKPKIWERLNGL